MEIRIDRSALLPALYLGQSVAEKKSTTPILSNIILRTQGSDTLLCAATDLRTTVVIELPATVIKEGQITLRAKQIHDIVRSLQEGEICLTATESHSVNVTSLKSRYKLVGLPGNDFPKFPGYQEVSFKEIHAATLADMITKTVFSVSPDDTRQHLSGILFECDGNQATMVSTDGHRLTKIRREIGDGPSFSPGVILPRKGVLEIRRLLEGLDGTCDIGFDDKHIFVSGQRIVISVALIEAAFPPYDRVIPKDNEKKILLKRDDFVRCLKRVSLMSSDRSWGVRLELNEDLLRLSTNSQDLGEAQEEIEIQYQGDPLTIGFNARYFLDILSEIDDEMVCLELNGDLDPGLVRPQEGRDYLGIVMPMRI